MSSVESRNSLRRSVRKPPVISDTFDPAKVRVERSSRPWFGPRKRAREYLALRREVVSPEEALPVLAGALGTAATAMQQIRFIDYWHHGESFRYTIALVWTSSDAEARQALFDLAEECVRLTGWYPLPQGERLRSQSTARELDRELERNKLLPIREPLGPLRCLGSAVSSEGGCCIRLETEEGSVLLDSGFEGAILPTALDRLCMVSHSHQDHSGGVKQLADSGLPILASATSARILVGRHLGDVSVRSRLHAVRPDAMWRLIGGGLEYRAFAVPHAPGSVGFGIRDETHCVFYTGDLVLRTHRLDFTEQLRQVLAHGVEGRRPWLIMDATMAGRSCGASQESAAREILLECKEGGDLVILARDPEQLLYAYLDLFSAVRSGPWRNRVSLLVADQLRPLFRFVHSGFITRDIEELDPFILAQYGRSMSAWGESRWLYWLPPRGSLPARDPGLLRIWMTTTSARGLADRAFRPLVAGIGKVETRDLAERLGGRAAEADTSAWTLHTEHRILQEFIASLSNEIEVCLFHNYPGRLRRFAKSLKRHVHVMDQCPVFFDSKR